MNYAYTEGSQNIVVSDITFVGLCLQRSYTELADSDEELISILDLLIPITNEAHRKHKPKHLRIADATAIGHNRPIIFPWIEEHIPKIKQGQSYKLTNIHRARNCA